MGPRAFARMVGRKRSARHDACVETTPGSAPSRAQSIAALEPVLSALAYSLTRTRVHARLVAAAGVPVDRPGLALLRVLAEEAEPLRVGELARRLDVRHPHVTRQVSQLAEQGLVERVAGDDDRRVQLIAPTRRGLDTLARVTRAAQARLAESLADVDPERIMAAVDVLSRLAFAPGWGDSDEDEEDAPAGTGGALAVRDGGPGSVAGAGSGPGTGGTYAGTGGAGSPKNPEGPGHPGYPEGPGSTGHHRSYGSHGSHGGSHGNPGSPGHSGDAGSPGNRGDSGGSGPAVSGAGPEPDAESAEGPETRG